MSSPYKKIKLTNEKWVAYVNISKLERNKAYKMEGLMETNHPSYGKGQQATIKSAKGLMYRTQLPGKYLAFLKPDMIDFMKKDIVEKRNPYLVYREQMMDNSYRIDILEKSAENDAHFEANADVPEEVTVSDEDDIAATCQPPTVSNDTTIQCVDNDNSGIVNSSIKVKTEHKSVPSSSQKVVSDSSQG